MIPRDVFAYDSSRPNNKFGIHLAQPDLNDLKKAADLVNSNGGDWGYVTLVMQDNERDKGIWQEVMDRLRELHLIPIIRLATHPEGATWARPKIEQAGEWAVFLDSLNWVIKDRYVILFNEPNHAGEWGGKVDPKNYSETAKIFAQKLKDKNNNYFVMLAGLDASAPSIGSELMDEEEFLHEVINNITIQQFNNLFSGLASHSYPNPGFVGSPYNIGRGTIHTYQWEKDLLSRLGLKDLPVFITETGWDGSRISEGAAANNILAAYQNVWLPDSRVVAVTPFVLNYQSEPFAKFSWSKMGNEDFYSQYFQVQSLYKKKGDPEIIDKGNLSEDIARQLVAHSNYHFSVSLENHGQAIWDKGGGYRLEIENFDPSLYLFSDLNNIKPGQEEQVDLYLKTNSLVGKRNIQAKLVRDKQTILSSKQIGLNIVPLPSLRFKAGLFPKLKTEGNNFEVQIFDTKQQLIFKKSGLTVKDRQGFIDEVQNIALDRKYRLVILKPYYLPRQQFLVFHRGENLVTFKSMYPLDFNRDGKFDFADLTSLIKEPKLFFLLLP